jgi:hypothetical protein
MMALVVGLLLVLCALGVRQLAIGVYGTRLPLDMKDLPQLEPKLAKLKPAERELVLGYLARSKGDVLPAKFADPDDPLTARTFGEAIELQRAWLVRDAQRQAKADALAAERDAAMRPLRDATDVRLVRRQILTVDELYGLPDSTTNTRGQTVKQPLRRDGVLVVTWRLRNTSGRTLASTQGSVSLRGADGWRVTDCWIDHTGTLQPGEGVEVRCGNTNRTAGDADRAFVAASASDYYLVWEPRTVTFADGTTLESEPRGKKP